MKYIKTSLIALIMCTFISCKVDFPLEQLGGEPLIYLDALAYSDDISEIGARLHIYTYGITPTGNRIPYEGRKCNIRTFLNNKQIYLYTNVELEPFSGLIVSTMESARPGDEVIVQVEGEGYAPIFAKTIIPQRPTKPEIKSTRINDNLINLKITLSDKNLDKNYYAFTFYQHTGDTPDDKILGESADLAFGSASDTGMANVGPFDVAWKDFGSQIYYGFSDASFNQKSKTFDLNLKISHKKGLRTYIRVSTISISEEKMKYSIAQYDKNSNILGAFGLAPITFAYTNVYGGTGYLGAQNAINSDWILID